MFVMKYQFPIEVPTMEYGYLENISVDKNGIAVCEYQATRDYLFSVGYDDLGEISSRDELPSFLEGKFGETTSDFKSLTSEVVSLDKILPSKIDVDDTPKYWWQKDQAVVGGNK